MNKIDMLQNVAKKTLDQVKHEYDFCDYEIETVNPDSVRFIGIAKGSLLIYFEINNREDVQLNLKDLASGTNAGLMTITSKLFGRFSEEKKKYFLDRKEKALRFKEGSSDYYGSALGSDIDLIKHHFPNIFKTGEFPDCLK